MRPWVWLGLTDAQRRWQRLVTLNPRSALGGEQAPRLTAVQEGATRTRSRIRIPVTRIPKQAGSCVRNAGSSGPPFHLADSLFQLVPSWGPSVDPDRGNSPSCIASQIRTPSGGGDCSALAFKGSPGLLFPGIHRSVEGIYLMSLCLAQVKTPKLLLPHSTHSLEPHKGLVGMAFYSPLTAFCWVL